MMFFMLYIYKIQKQLLIIKNFVKKYVIILTVPVLALIFYQFKFDSKPKTNFKKNFRRLGRDKAIELKAINARCCFKAFLCNKNLEKKDFISFRILGKARNALS
jgi:hypothetical protein